ncbi:MAG: hypothetical protein DHS20C12_09850 [Pseudohongiella sp.]|nr:MAG: hypothetical protein DHS20C12_09850 [Pseudohongiella sp.]
MDIPEDIALGDFNAADLIDLVEGEGDAGRRSPIVQGFLGFQLSFAVSLFIHLAIASALIYFVAGDIEYSEETAPALVRVEFVATNPLLTQAEEVPPVAAAEPTSADEQEPPPFENPLSEPSQSLASDASAAADLIEPEVVSREGLLPPVDILNMPTVESVQQVLNSIERDDASRFYTYDCNKLEEEQEFNNCAPDDDRDYASATRNPVYDFHNPAIEVTRSEQTLNTLARQSALVSGQLALGDLPTGLSAYVLEELEQGIETYSNKSSRTIEHMNTMVDKSAAGAMSRRMFDTWTQQQSEILRSRRAENGSEQAFRERCRGYEKYIMAPVEFARCLSIDESPLGFTLDF